MADKAIPQRILEYVQANAIEGDVTSVIDTIDFCCYNFEKDAINVGKSKGNHLEKIVRDCRPQLALELGAYAGYSALRIARALPKDGKLFSVESDKSNVDVTRKMVDFAGMKNQITVLYGNSQDVLRSLSIAFDFVFLDHLKTIYKQDLLVLEEQKLIHNGSVIVADNVINPGSPGYLEYVRNNPKYECTTFFGNLCYGDLEDGIEKSVYRE